VLPTKPMIRRFAVRQVGRPVVKFTVPARLRVKKLLPASFGGSIAPAMAADIPIKAPAKVSPFAAPPSQWSGSYSGLGGGDAASRNSLNTLATPTRTDPNFIPTHGADPMKALAASLILLGLGLGYASDASAQSPACPTNLPDGVQMPNMTIKIFNDDPDGHYIFPVLTTGQGSKDIWMQAIFAVPQALTGGPTGENPICPYGRAHNYRFYINPTAGIAPGKSVFITVPLYTQLVVSPNPKVADQYIDWWNGGTVQVFNSSTSTPPRALTEDLNGMNSLLNQQPLPTPPVVSPATPLPTCDATNPNPCALKFFSDTTDLPKNDPAQLLEYTLGARVQQVVKNQNTDPTNTLDLRNVDFDVSYVNVAFAPAAMGPYQNDQVGYVGTPQSINKFTTALNQFLTDFPNWPQFVRTYADKSTETLLKLPSPLEVFSRIVPGALAPPDLTAPPTWPTQLWTPIQALRNNWVTYAGSIGKTGTCTRTLGTATFCNALLDAKQLMMDNFANYQRLGCAHPQITLTDDIMISHVYGWTPFIESTKDGTPCGPAANNLEKTPTYSNNNYAKYLQVKLEFDSLNYGKYTDTPRYAFNPWVMLIHNTPYIAAPNAYAYSVDDAVGNIQAEGLGFIVDVGDTLNLENKMPAGPPINVNLGFATTDPIRFTNYRVCTNTPARDKPVNPAFSSFVVNANNPSACPVFLLDNKVPQQLYTFTITTLPQSFPLFTDPAKANWTAETSAPIDCSGNGGTVSPTPPYQKSSATWCCTKLVPPNGAGIYAFRTIDPTSIHQLNIYNVQTPPAEKSTSPQINAPCHPPAYP
jgi:hypothetical protein